MPIKKRAPVLWEAQLAVLLSGKTIAEYGTTGGSSIKDSPQIPYSIFAKAR
jgi:hypothetical protein